MNISMVGIDYKLAEISVREKVSLSSNRIKELLKELTNEEIKGVVILSTCNRTEIYIESKNYLTSGALVQILEESGGLAKGMLKGCHYIRRGNQLITYLFALACGMHSMIIGDDQIITQVGEAMDLSVKQGTGCPVLNTIFRHSVTCAKKAKSLVNIKHISPSIVTMAVEKAKPYINNSNVLIIGNGEIGRLAASAFVNLGCNVSITLRSYKYKQVEIPRGCKTIPYEKREKAISWANIIVSATKSPHFTLVREMVSNNIKAKTLMLDLALPRDIEPEIGELDLVTLYDVDLISQGECCIEKEALEQIDEIIKEQLEKYQSWLSYYSQNQRKAAV